VQQRQALFALVLIPASANSMLANLATLLCYAVFAVLAAV
jgi:hypothetical protein